MSQPLQLAQGLVIELLSGHHYLCREELGHSAHGDERNLLLLNLKETNDAGFAMTSSTSMHDSSLD